MKPNSKLATGALVSAVLAAVGVLAAAVIQSYAARLNPRWRGDEFAERWLLVLLLPAAVLTLNALILAVMARSSPTFRTWRNGWRANAALALTLLTIVMGLAVRHDHERRFHSSVYSSCLANVKNLAIALNMYTTDYDALPAAGTWCDQLLKYVKNPDIYKCPDAPGERCSYAYNDRLGSFRYSRLANPASVVALFESDRGWNAHGGPELLPLYPRHLKGDNYGFADGSARWFARKSESVSGQREPQWLKAPADSTLTWPPKVTP